MIAAMISTTIIGIKPLKIAILKLQEGNSAENFTVMHADLMQVLCCAPLSAASIPAAPVPIQPVQFHPISTRSNCPALAWLHCHLLARSPRPRCVQMPCPTAVSAHQMLQGSLASA